MTVQTAGLARGADEWFARHASRIAVTVPPPDFLPFLDLSFES